MVTTRRSAAKKEHEEETPAPPSRRKSFRRQQEEEVVVEEETSSSQQEMEDLLLPTPMKGRRGRPKKVKPEEEDHPTTTTTTENSQEVNDKKAEQEEATSFEKGSSKKRTRATRNTDGDEDIDETRIAVGEVETEVKVDNLRSSKKKRRSLTREDILDDTDSKVDVKTPSKKVVSNKMEVENLAQHSSKKSKQLDTPSKAQKQQQQVRKEDEEEEVEKTETKGTQNADISNSNKVDDHDVNDNDGMIVDSNDVNGNDMEGKEKEEDSDGDNDDEDDAPEEVSKTAANEVIQKLDSSIRRQEIQMYTKQKTLRRELDMRNKAQRKQKLEATLPEDVLKAGITALASKKDLLSTKEDNEVSRHEKTKAATGKRSTSNPKHIIFKEVPTSVPNLKLQVLNSSRAPPKVNIIPQYVKDFQSQRFYGSKINRDITSAKVFRRDRKSVV